MSGRTANGRTTRCLTFATAAALLAATPPARASAQAAAPADAASLADRVRHAGTATVTLRFATRPGVCGDGARRISVHDEAGTTRVGRWTSYDGDPSICEPGPARVTLGVDGGAVRTLQVTVGDSRRSTPGTADRAATDLGTVDGSVAAAYLLDVAVHTDGETADRAVFAAAIAGDAVVWPDLLRLARGSTGSGAAHRAAAFWAGQFACDAVRTRAMPVAVADTTDREIRKQVVFAISQRPSDERTPALTRVARSDRDPEMRCAALFWLGQVAGGAPPGTLDLYESVLRTR